MPSARIRHSNFPLLLRTLLIALLLLAILGYIYFQARFFIEGPQIELETPTTVLQSDQVVSVSGYARNVTEITLNGAIIHTNESGYFSEQLVLPEGYTIMTLRAKDRYNRTTFLTRKLVYRGQ